MGELRDARRALSAEERRELTDKGFTFPDGVLKKKIGTVYISGPMRGLPEYNYPMFNEVATQLREDATSFNKGTDLGAPLKVLNPAENFDGDTSKRVEDYLALDIQQVTKADALVLLPGWRSSEGAQLEISVALATGKRFFVASRDYKRTGGVDLTAVVSSGWTFEEIVPDLVRLQSGQDVAPAGPETIEEEASRLVRNGPRQKTYGHPRGDFDRVAGMWSALLGIPLTAEDVAVMMIAFKLARLKQTPQHRDSKVDVIGYAICLDRLDEPEGIIQEPDWTPSQIEEFRRTVAGWPAGWVAGYDAKLTDL